MEHTRRTTIALALASSDDESLWRGILGTQDVPSLSLGHARITPDGFSLGADHANCAVLVADAPVLIACGLPPAKAARWLRDHRPGMALIVRLPHRAGMTRAERNWAEAKGIASLLPGGSVASWRESILPMAARIHAVAGLDEPDAATMKTYLDNLVKHGVEPRPGPVKDIYADAYLLESQGIDALALLHEMQAPGGLPVEDRTYRGKRYPACFVASDAVAWVEQHLSVRHSIAEAACRFLWRTGRIHHVVREARFTDDFLFFRFSGSRQDQASVDLARLEQAMRAPGGLDIQDRSWRGKDFPQSFVGTEAVEWIMAQQRLSFGAAEAAGQSLLELGALSHVVGEHEFMGEAYFYRLAEDAMVAVRRPATSA